jgi:hypothetical protein
MKAQGTRVVPCATMRCIDCDFDLERISEPRCPECGRAFDRHDAGTFIGPGHTRVSRRLAQAPGWPMFALAGLLAILILQVDFGPGASFPAQLLALVASLAVGLAFIMRLLGAVLGHRTLPRRRPRIVPIALWRWLFPIALVVAADMLASAHAPRAIAFWLDRTILEPLAVGPTVEPSKWSAVRAWSGSVTRGAVWDDIEVATIEWTPPEKGARDPIQGGYGLEWKSDEVHYTAAGGEEKIAPIVRIALPRLAVFPINGIGYGGSSKAWAYAPGAPDVFLPIPTGPDEVLGYRFVRYEGDWFVSRGLLFSLRDRP